MDRTNDRIERFNRQILPGNICIYEPLSKRSNLCLFCNTLCVPEDTSVNEYLGVKLSFPVKKRKTTFLARYHRVWSCKECFKRIRKYIDGQYIVDELISTLNSPEHKPSYRHFLHIEGAAYSNRCVYCEMDDEVEIVPNIIPRGFEDKIWPGVAMCKNCREAREKILNGRSSNFYYYEGKCSECGSSFATTESYRRNRKGIIRKEEVCDSCILNYLNFRSQIKASQLKRCKVCNVPNIYLDLYKDFRDFNKPLICEECKMTVKDVRHKIKLQRNNDIITLEIYFGKIFVKNEKTGLQNTFDIVGKDLEYKRNLLRILFYLLNKKYKDFLVIER